jgi:hypothetical protein
MVCLHISTTKNKKKLAGHLWQQIVHQIVCRFVHKIAHVDGPLDARSGSRTIFFLVFVVVLFPTSVLDLTSVVFAWGKKPRLSKLVSNL